MELLSLPGEVLDHIVDLLHDDPFTLRSCSLVCRALVPAARFHTFQHVALRQRWSRLVHTQLEAFVLLLESPHCTFPTFVTRLTFQELDADFPWPATDAYSVLRKRLPALASIAFTQRGDRGQQIGSQLPGLKTFLPHYTHLASVVVNGALFTFLDDLLQFLAILPSSLEMLELASLSWDREEVFWSETIPFPAAQSLRTLRLYSSEYGVDAVSEVLDHFVASTHGNTAGLQLRTLQLLQILPQDFAAVGRFIDALGGILEDVSFGFSQDPPSWNADMYLLRKELDADIETFLASVDLRKLTSLRRFQFHTQHLDMMHDLHEEGKRTFTHRLLPAMLGSLAGIRPLDEVTIRLSFNAWHTAAEYGAARQLDALAEWSELDAALVKLEGVSRVVFCAGFERYKYASAYRGERVSDARHVHEEAVGIIPMRLPRMGRERNDTLSFAVQMPAEEDS
uniref:F-box domain-containing protein n=1 Tax=Mycena chlorophos TaxID=658473 RepID=A0ABQ0MCY9_MYCCL|nr:predicted protein [Mycena chlorophos]